MRNPARTALRLAALAGTALAQRALRALAPVAGVRWDQPVEWVGGPWIERAPSNARNIALGLSIVSYLDTDPSACPVSFPWRNRVVRLGPVVVAVEDAHDGGGTARVFLARDELTGAGADLMRACWDAWWQRQEEEARCRRTMK